MSGYKRVNFYELCRLCATNQQKEKTHIFQEEGRKIQLQNKIQSCLSLKVCENDFLPKVVCSQCLRTLEECSAFRKECYTSETMLSSYFNNFRYTEDFKKSGKVYIKDTSPKVIATTELPVQTTTSVVNTISNSNNGNSNNNNTNAGCNVNVVSNVNNNVSQESVPYYTLHLPSVIPQTTQECKSVKDTKIVTQPQIVYNLNAIKAVIPNITKASVNETFNNVALNSNGEIITIAPLVDMDTLFTQNVVQKPQKKIHKKHKITDSGGKHLDDSNVIKIDLTQPEVDVKRETFEKIKMQQNKVSYTIKVDDASKGSFVLNPLEVNNTTNINRTNANFNANQSILLNSNSPRSSVSNINTNRIPKTYPNFNNINLNNNVPTSGINIPITNINPTSDAINNLNPEPPPSLNVSSTLNVSVSNFNSIQNMHYSVSNHKQENMQVENNIGITSSDTVVLTNMFSTTNASITTNNNQTACSVLRNGTNSILNPITTQNINFSNLNPAPSFSTNTSNINNSLPANNQTSNFNNSTTDSLTKPDDVIKRHSCDICCKTFKRREHLYQHVKLHTGFRPFKCENCNKSFMRKEHLLRHMTSHSGQKNFTCNVCEKSFSRNDNLLKHKKIHNKQNSFTCEICQKQFVMEHYYLAHKHTHDSEKLNNPVWGLLKAI